MLRVQVIDLGAESISSSEYAQLGRITEFRYGRDVGRVFRGRLGFDQLRQAIESGWLPTDRALAFVDNHDNQRGHGAGGADILTFYDGSAYRAAVAFVLAHPYGLARVMSSYRWNGGPHRCAFLSVDRSSCDLMLKVRYYTNGGFTLNFVQLGCLRSSKLEFIRVYIVRTHSLDSHLWCGPTNVLHNIIQSQFSVQNLSPRPRRVDLTSLDFAFLNNAYKRL